MKNLFQIEYMNRLQRIILSPALSIMVCCSYAREPGVGSTMCRNDKAVIVRYAPAIYRLGLVTDSLPDVSSVDAVLRSLLRPGMTDDEKCEAIRRLVWQSRYHSPDSTANHYTLADPIVFLNCFCGYICSQDSAAASALWTAAGYEARAYELGWHTTPEAFYDEGWHNYDVTLWETNRLKAVREKDGRRVVLGVDEREAGWVKGGKPQRWDVFDIGHRMDLTLRRGETFTRYWQPTGTGVDYYLPAANQGPPRDTRDRMRFAYEQTPRPFAPLPRDAAYANGEFEFAPDLSAPAYRDLVEAESNLACAAGGGSGPALHPCRTGSTAAVVYKVYSPYLISGGWVEATFFRRSPADRVNVRLSTDHGASWTNLPVEPGTGRSSHRLGIRETVAGRFDYLLRLEFTAAEKPADAGLESLRIKTIVNVNPFTLPALKAGTNRVTLSAGEQLDTVEIYPDLQDPACLRRAFRADNVAVRRPPGFAPWACGLGPQDPSKPSELIYRLECPGEIAGVEWGGRFVTFTRAKIKDRPVPVCSNAMDYSFDQRAWHAQPWTYRYARKDPHTEKLQEFHLESIPVVPTGAREVFLRYRFSRTPQPDPEEKMEELLMPSLRIQAACKPQVSGPLPPLEAALCWEEGDVEKLHVEVARQLPHTYTINVKGTDLPRMKWVRLRLVEPR